MSSPAGSSLWRAVGMSYLQYVNTAASVVRASLKEPLKTQAAGRNKVNMSAFKWKNGERGNKVEATSMKEVAEAFKA